jgi:mRNA interferase HigB
LTRLSQNAKLKVPTTFLMHIISRKKLLEAAKRFADADRQLDGWYRTAKSAQWKSLAYVRRTYSHADPVKVGDVVYTIFNICGNKLRLIAEIFYEDQTILVRHVLTHEEYDKEAWKK